MKVDARQFLEVTRDPLAEGNADRLAAVVEQRWSAEQLCPLLKQADVDVRRVAAVVLGLVGGLEVAHYLVDALKDEDGQVNQMAEHALWAIWFRSCSCQACEPFQRGVELLAEEAYQEAVDAFHESLAIDPDFAEAHHQCAIALFFLNRWDDSIAENLAALAGNAEHFGAMTGIGHCYAHLAQLEKARWWYGRALEVNPRMPTIQRAIKQLQEQVGSRFLDRG